MKIAREEGFRNGIFKGMNSTIFRETPAYAGQFGTYLTLNKLAAKIKGVD